MVTRTPVMPSLDGSGQLSGQTVPHFLYQVPEPTEAEKKRVRILLVNLDQSDLFPVLGL